MPGKPGQGPFFSELENHLLTYPDRTPVCGLYREFWVRSQSVSTPDPSDHRIHRVLLVLDPRCEAAGLDAREPGGLKVELDQARVAVVVEAAPHRHRLGPEA